MQDRHSRKRKGMVFYFVIFLLFLLIMMGGLGVLVFNNLQRPVDKNSKEEIDFVIESGTSPTTVAQNLYQLKLIKHPLIFKYYLWKTDLGGKIQAGDFTLSKAMSLSEVSQTLTKAKSKQIVVTLLEGWRVEEVADYLEQVLTEAGLTFDKDVFLNQREIKEGYVYPDTYYLSLNTNEEAIAKTIEANFNQKIAPFKNQIETSKYTLDQILTMASIVEREARTDRPIVAGILWKRFENDWPLQADATLQYAKGYNRLTKEWWTPPYAIDKEIDSPYNSYANTGLPPAPIANPSLSSIEAALNPTETEYWFYITDNTGGMHYAVDYDGHLANVNRYLR